MESDKVVRLYVGNLPDDCTQREVEEEFEKFGKIVYCELKRTVSGLPFAFVEFSDYRDARDAIKNKDGAEFNGKRLRVEVPFSSKRQSRRSDPPRKGKYLVEVTGLPPTGSWQDLKDHLRAAGECGHANVFRGGVGEVSFFSRGDMEYAIDKFDGSTFKSHQGEKARITVREKSHRRSRSRHRSRKRSYSGSRSYSRSRSRSRSRHRR
ncbi:splicing factor 1, putative [Theileria equi strain WA]|uniref:Splicing factor 1, putative n=1 Tax=Theileria equi strain WA TaxID=1537102 RepID=L0B208_THEEQ|nr:splicing factor 1, putative [Theileria equi strain WA]AFZ81169.1 splicing factor 1, putative [Theileria equi strain WA]|eukprot:XP_004830835.1 splicing factor 1, putative [Theileria equi strain WA]